MTLKQIAFCSCVNSSLNFKNITLFRSSFASLVVVVVEVEEVVEEEEEVDEEEEEEEEEDEEEVDF